MSVLFATPCYGGQVTAQHFRSCLDTKEVLTQVGLKHDWLIMWNESLVQRARNNLAKEFLETDYQKLMFLDADIEFTADDVSKVWNLQADIAVGVYTMKKIGAGYAAWVKGKLVKDLDKFNEPINVDYAGTGFMMIDRSVFEKMRDLDPSKIHEEGTGTSYAWFDPRVDDGIYLSEDYAFCKDARAIGYDITMDPSVKLIHHGHHAYGPQ